MGAPDLRALNLPLPIPVKASETGQPRAVQLGEQWVQVAEVVDSWRIDEEWWRQEIVRRYYLLLLEDGQSLTVFHSPIGPVHGSLRHGSRHGESPSETGQARLTTNGSGQGWHRQSYP